jgi:hypothetical protein
MVARLTPPPVKLTQENHPENAVEPPAVKAPTVSLPAMIGFGAVSGVIGMAFGSAVLSSALAFDTPGHVASLIPLAVTVVAFLSGWAGAFFWMIQEEKTNKP